MARFIEIQRENAFRGKLIISYNLKIVAVVLIALAALALVGIIGYGLLYILPIVWGWICSGATWLWGNIWWLLGIPLLLFLLYLLAKHWPKMKISRKARNISCPAWGKYVLGGLLLLLLLFLGFRSCGNDDNEMRTEQETTAVSQQRVVENFNFIVTSRAYLDGVQDADDNISRALVGLKYVNEKEVTASDFVGQTYKEAEEVIAQDWGQTMEANLSGVELSNDQLVIATLFAMRNGKYGFEKSDFLAALKRGEIEDAHRYMALHKASGEKRVLRAEAQQYLWVLKNLWIGNLTVRELLDLPSFSYKRIQPKDMYEKNGEIIFNKELKEILHKGDFKTPREALDLKALGL